MRIFTALVFITLIITCCKGGVAMASEEIKLTSPITKGSVSIEETLLKRRSVRSFKSKALTLEQISQLLWAAQGITNAYGFRTAPSAGALYPLEVYALTGDGVYRYNPENHSLILTSKADKRAELVSAALGQSFIASAPLDIVVTAVFERVTRKYGDRGVRYVHIESGHAAENILLQATALGLGGVPIGAFQDGKVSKTLNLPDDHKPLYIIPIGYPK
jgi:SagB-type dehydrogenase family enzyme